MSLKNVLPNKKELSDIITTFDNFAMIEPEIQGIVVQKLPACMRLVEYFLANYSPTDDSYYQIRGEAKINAFESKGNTSINQMNSGQLRICIDNEVLTHKGMMHKPKPFCKEELYLFAEEMEGEPQTTLHSGNAKYNAGHDFREINKLGSIIYVDEEFFNGFMSKNSLNFDRNKYYIKSSRYELLITPRFDVNEINFNATTNNIIEITNQVLKILETKYDKQCQYFKIPQSTSQ